MERYIEQLIDDIHKATWNIRPPHEIWELSEADPDNELELEDMAFAEKHMYGKKKRISKITGIDFGLLPPSNKLTSQQQAHLATELEKLLQLFHFTLDFPENYPADLRYPFILKIWNEKHVPLSFGDDHIEFCDMNEDVCPFPGYCTSCKEVAAQMKFDEETGYPACDFPEGELINFEEMNGFFDDDGNKIGIHDIPVPDLCKECKYYQINDWDENLLCLMNRSDQRNNANFKCGAFDKL